MRIEYFTETGVLDKHQISGWGSGEPEDRARASITSALVAFAAGDAFGVAYEYRKEKIPVDTVHVGSRADWPQGGVSDDTLLSLLTIFAMEPGKPEKSSQNFLDALRRNLPKLRGLGPTTRSALGIKLRPEEEEAIKSRSIILGNTNGGMMRTSLIGLAYAPSFGAERRTMVAELARATHKDPIAVGCSVLASKLYSEATTLENKKDLYTLLQSELAEIKDAPESLVKGIREIDKWQPPIEGISLDPLETLSAVFWTVTHANTTLEAYRIACELGGDTDTVAALASGLFAARDPLNSKLFEISWLDEVLWSEIDQLKQAIEVLVALRN